MLSIAWNTLLVNPLLNILIGLYKISGSLGISIIGLTFIIKGILIPATLPTIKNMKKQRELQPELSKIKKKYKNDKKKQAEVQMELFKKHGINPTSGCLTQLVTLFVIIALFNVIRSFALNGSISSINPLLYFDILRFNKYDILDTTFLYLDLAKPDPFYIMGTVSALLQLIATKMTMPLIKKAEKAAKKTPEKSDDMALMMQQQSMYMMPIMNFIFGITLPSGIMLYIVTTTVFTIVQNYFVSGLGGLKPWIEKLNFGKSVTSV